MRKILMTLALCAFITPAFATGNDTGNTYHQNWDHSTNTTQNNNQSLNFLQKIDQRLNARAEANQKQQQGQGQGQNQTAMGGAGGAGGSANNNNNVNVDNRTKIVNAPPIYGNGDTYGVSIAIGGAAGGGILPSKAYGAGKAAANLRDIGSDRKMMYTQCSVPASRAYLELNNIRCDLANARRWNDVRAWESQFEVKKVSAKAPKKVYKKTGKRKAKAKGCGCK